MIFNRLGILDAFLLNIFNLKWVYWEEPLINQKASVFDEKCFRCGRDKVVSIGSINNPFSSNNCHPSTKNILPHFK
jgi:hypothetical protein